MIGGNWGTSHHNEAARPWLACSFPPLSVGHVRTYKRAKYKGQALLIHQSSKRSNMGVLHG